MRTVPVTVACLALAAGALACVAPSDRPRAHISLLERRGPASTLPDTPPWTGPTEPVDPPAPKIPEQLPVAIEPLGVELADEPGELAAVAPEPQPLPEPALPPASAEPENATPTPASAPRTPRALVPGDVLLGAPIAADGGAVLGAVRDALIDPATGAVSALLVAPAADAPPVLVAWDAVVGLETEPAARLVLAPNAGLDDPHTRLFDGRAPETVRGRVTGVELVGAGAAPPSAIVKVHDDATNLLHRALVAAASLVLPDAAALEGGTVEVTGLLTRDERGKLWVASAITRNGERVAVRSETGAVRWAELAQRAARASGLAGREIATPDGPPLVVRGWRIDPATGAVAELIVEDRGARLTLPWDAIERGADGAWSLALDDAPR